MATYKEIQTFIERKYFLKVKTCWIAHVKDINGITTRRAPNRLETVRRYPCPDYVRPMIENAMYYYGMLPTYEAPKKKLGRPKKKIKVPYSAAKAKAPTVKAPPIVRGKK